MPTETTTRPRTTNEGAQFIRDLRAAGWCHSTEWVATVFEDEDAKAHLWHRGEERIRVTPEPHAEGFFYDLSYEPGRGEDWDMDYIAVGSRWTDLEGTARIRLLAVALGILPAEYQYGVEHASEDRSYVGYAWKHDEQSARTDAERFGGFGAKAVRRVVGTPEEIA